MIPEIRIVQTSDTKQILALYESLGYRQVSRPLTYRMDRTGRSRTNRHSQNRTDSVYSYYAACAWRSHGVDAGLARKCCM